MEVRDRVQIDMLRDRTNEKLKALKLIQAQTKLDKLENNMETLVKNIEKQKLLVRRLQNG